MEAPLLAGLAVVAYLGLLLWMGNRPGRRQNMEDFTLGGKRSPWWAVAFGMIGTLIGLVAMLSNMDDPSKIGAGMAAALLTTLYGALLANMLFLPLADKLASRSSEEVLLKTIVIQGVMAIQSGDNPRNVESKLRTFLPPEARVAEGEDKAAA